MFSFVLANIDGAFSKLFSDLFKKTLHSRLFKMYLNATIIMHRRNETLTAQFNANE